MYYDEGNPCSKGRLYTSNLLLDIGGVNGAGNRLFIIYVKTTWSNNGIRSLLPFVEVDYLV